ncbi:enoyl-CoA hydratase/carnithine racemase [Rhodoblastus acidophilus]|uniref:enoyl-CoA hydratase n=1 Tax=Rhodoblastus acidophilus TaxID=1074 RepID=UPI00222447B1|nr:enoyl-CoA hydratase [Rhodoblastus acidophilus]MCW2286112.1 enoyl-CoA hydratase/carnithine racemase [Rhodoblastus acidophilus]MCW2335006.1 enoyl-CoA hydratase/carnithine racemase [Rhodoblastus acidophilus]
MDIETTVADGVMEFTLNRPAKKNALTEAMYLAMLEGFAKAEADDGIGAVLIRAKGDVFSAGNDIGDFVAAVQKGQGLAAADFVRKLASFPKPLVAAVNGLAVGVGCTLLLHCDLVFASDAARFSLPFVDLGLPPEAGSSLLLPRRIGLARASAMLLLAEPMDAREAKEAGLVNGVVADDELAGVAREKARRLASKPRAALMDSRRLLRGDSSEISARMEEEFKAFLAALHSPQTQAVFAAFLGKNK